MSLPDTTAHSILCCWANKANIFLWISVLVPECLLYFLKHRSEYEADDRVLPKSPFCRVWMSLILVLWSLQEFWPTCPRIFESLLHTEVRIKHILLMNDIIKRTASHFCGQIMLSSILNLNQTAELLIKISHDSQS